MIGWRHKVPGILGKGYNGSLTKIRGILKERVQTGGLMFDVVVSCVGIRTLPLCLLLINTSDLYIGCVVDPEINIGTGHRVFINPS